MKKTVVGFLFALFLSVAAFAQSVQEGVNHLYAQRYQSARSTFQKLLSANPNNIEANYWLGQTLLAEKKVAEARDVYQKALTASNNAPLLLAGMGGVNLYEGKKAEALQQFETAINASKGRKGNDPAVLNAVGRAIVEAYSNTKEKYGDIDYAIAKLTEATQLAPNNPDAFLNLGNAYRAKTGHGGQAVLNYMKAKQLNPSFAPASYRMALLYKTQVKEQYPDQWGNVLENLNNAVAADPKFAPAYFELYYYYLLSKRDFATADTYAQKYTGSADPGVQNDYIIAQTNWLQGKFTEAANTLKNILAQTNNNPPITKVFRLMAHTQLSLKDTASACEYINQFFAKANQDDINAADWILHAQSCGRGNPDIMRADIMKAIELDTVVSEKVTTLRDFAAQARKDQQRLLEAELGLMAFKLEEGKGNPIRLITDIAIPYYFGGTGIKSYEEAKVIFLKADSAARAYAALAPDSIYGWQWSARPLNAIDTNLEQGLPIPSYEKVLEVAGRDKVKYKSQGISAAQALAIYHYNVKNDMNAALSYAEKGLEFDPDHANLTQIRDAAKKALTPRQNQPRQSTPSKTGTKNSTSTNAAKTDAKTKTTTAPKKKQ